MDGLNAVPVIGAVARLKLVGELAGIRKRLGAGGVAARERLRLTARANQIRIELGAAKTADKAAKTAAAPETPRARADAYEFDSDRKPAQRKRDNAAAMSILAQIDAGEIDPSKLTDDQRRALARYSGTGGALIGADGKKGSAYEYYTPKPVAEGVWSLMSELGFSGGKVLDPSAGTGIFGATAPTSAAVDAIELNETSGRINGLVNDGPGYKATVAPFEKVAAATPDEEYDAVVTNVPFGGVADRGGNQLHDSKYQREPLQNYFILRGLEKLRPGGLAVFITPPRCVSGKGGKEEELRVRASYAAEFLGAYRLPNSVFGTAAADTMTDVIAFRKYSREVAEKIGELKEQNPQLLIDANVQWQDFIGGHYFDRDGKRFVLGEFVAKDPNKFRDADRVITKASVGEIGKMLRKFPESRVNWDMLNATETAAIVYRDGDTITQGGQTLEMRDGRWHALAKTEGSYDACAGLERFKTPYSAFENGERYAQAVELIEFLVKTSQALDIPTWLRQTVTELGKLKDEGERGKCWTAGVVGLSVLQVLGERLQDESGVNFVEEYDKLSEAMARAAAAAKSRPSVLGGKLRDGLLAVGMHYSKKSGYSAVWRGDVKELGHAVAVNADAGFEGFRYRTKSAWVGIDDAKTIYGEDFDPHAAPAWCVSATGKSVTRADDYYVGNYADFIKRVDADIASAADDKTRQKLLRQKLDAGARIDKVDVSRLTFNLFSPHVTVEEKAAFMRRFVHPAAAVVYDEKTGEKRVDIDIPGSNLTDREKLLNRIGDYMKNGTITLGGLKLGMDDATALRELRRMVNTANEQFNGWVRGNTAICDRIEAIASDPARLRFQQVEDEAALVIPGMSNAVTPHGYQNAFIRKQGREFGGINGFAVGLGKTISALASVQYAHAIGVKQKTIFTVPNSVLSNWRKEAMRAFESVDDSLFVGLRFDRDGNADVKSSEYDADLTAVLENRHAKIFMTMEAFERIRLRDATIADYEKYLRQVDSSFAESEDKKADERAKGKQSGLMAVLSQKKGAAPFLEDMGVDSIVIDEGHMHKNSTEVVDFKSAKYLSLPPASKRGIDAQAKAWFVREKSSLKDGVLLLSATPISNSPQEIFSVLSLACGRERVNDMFLGIKGADEFMEMMCAKENQDDVTIDGEVRTTDVFVGLNNVGVLRKAIAETMTIKTAADVGAQIEAPDSIEKQTQITLPEAVVDRLTLYKNAFRYAIDAVNGKSGNRGSKEAFDTVSEHFGEPIDLIAHPFNLINKMTLLISDPELDQRATFYAFAPTQADKARDAISKFNTKKFVEERQRPWPMTDASAVVGKRIVKDTAGDEKTYLKIEIRAKIVDGGIVIDTMDNATQTAFEVIADAAGLDLDVSVPPKLAAMLENFQNEQAVPRGVDGDGKISAVVKQLIFCDILPLHNKIKRLLAKRAGVPASAIAVVTGKINNEPDEILAVQDGFNAHGDANKYRVVIANEKAEIGINLQQGTQAIHHLTIGWTPDSITQRNGRGVRQGNKTGSVTVYYYDADGTFDSSKRAMVNHKADWIGDVMDANGSGTVAVSGGMSREQMEAMIDVVGDADAMKRMQETVAAKEAEARAVTVRDKQIINIDIIQKQRDFLAKNDKPTRMIAEKVLSLYRADANINSLRQRANSPKATATTVARLELAVAEAEEKARRLRREIEDSVVFTIKNGWGDKALMVPITLTAVFEKIRGIQSGKDVDIMKFLVGYDHRGLAVDAVAGSALHSDWQSEVDMAKSMVEEAKGNFARHAESKGAYPAAVVDAVAAGDGAMVADKPIVKGTFFRYQGALGIVTDDLRLVEFCKADGTWTTAATDRALADAETIYPGDSAYDACIGDAAEIEDKAARNGEIESRFHEAVPVVAQRRQTEVLASYRIGSYLLPSPHFPSVIDPDDASTPVRDKIRAEQKQVINRFDGKHFVVSGSLAVAGYANFDEDEALRDYAVANSLKLRVEDFGGSTYPIEKLMGKTAGDDAFKAALTGKTADEIKAQARTYVSELFPWLELGEKMIMPMGFSWAFSDAITRVNAPASAAAALPNESADDVVAISGKTFAWKEDIKSAASAVGSKFKFEGVSNAWLVKRAAWTHLVQQKPQAGRELHMTKSPYGTL